jgi:O-antigen/teichoic acid export membrane protein
MEIYPTAKQKIKDFFIWVQKYVRTDVLYLVRGGFWLTSGSVVSAVVAFTLAVVTANYLPKEIFGTYKYILSIAGVLMIFSLGGMGASLSRSVARGYEGSLIPAVKANVAWGIISGLGGIAVSFYYFFHHNAVLGLAFLIIAGFLPLKDNLAVYLNWLEGKKYFAKMSAYIITSQISTTAVIILAIIFSQNLFLILLAYFAPRVLIHFIFLIKTLREIPREAKRDPGVISYGMHLSLLGILVELAGQLDKILVWNSLGAVSLATYSFATAPTSQIRSFLNNIFPLSFPKLAQRTTDELRKTLPRKMLIMLGGISIVVAAYILAAPYLFKIFFPKYMDSVFFSQIFVLTLLFLPRGILTDAITIHAPKKVIYLSSLSTSFVKLVSLVVFVRMFGILGAIFSYLTGEAYLTLISIFFFRKI